MKLLTFVILSRKWLFYCCHKSFEYLNSPKFQFLKSRKLSDLCYKIYQKLREGLRIGELFQVDLDACSPGKFRKFSPRLPIHCRSDPVFNLTCQIQTWEQFSLFGLKWYSSHLIPRFFSQFFFKIPQWPFPSKISHNYCFQVLLGQLIILYCKSQ